MNYLDIILGILLVLSAFNGFSKGFIEELAGLVALILGIWAAIHFSGLVADYLVNHLHFTFQHLTIASFIITFIIVVILVHVVGMVVSKVIKSASLGFLNRLAGFAFGVIKGALILSVVLVVFNRIDDDVHIISPQKKAESRLYEPIRNFAPRIFPFLDFWGEFDHKGSTQL
jgi:membrane protein required for colicin V production